MIRTGLIKKTLGREPEIAFRSTEVNEKKRYQVTIGEIKAKGGKSILKYLEVWDEESDGGVNIGSFGPELI